MAVSKAICEYYRINIKTGGRDLSGPTRGYLAKLEKNLEDGAIIIGIPKNLDQHHRDVIEPILKLFTKNFGAYDLIKIGDLNNTIKMSRETEQQVRADYKNSMGKRLGCRHMESAYRNSMIEHGIRVFDEKEDFWEND